MFQPIKSLWHKQPPSLGEDDIRLFIEMWLRREIGTDALVCQSAQAGTIKVRVGTPALQQEVLLLEYDLKAAMLKETGVELKTLTAFVG